MEPSPTSHSTTTAHPDHTSPTRLMESISNTITASSQLTQQAQRVLADSAVTEHHAKIGEEALPGPRGRMPSVSVEECFIPFGPCPNCEGPQYNV
jgi:hypothetical protein